MDSGMPFPFVELYGNNAQSPKIVPGVSVASWKLDSNAARCGICIKKFSVLRRRHHCRACGDICCKRCLGFCLVNVPQLGVDLAYTCAKCIRRHAHQTSLAHDFAHLALSFDGASACSPRAGGRRKSGTFLTQSASECGSPVGTGAGSALASPCSLASALTPCGSPRAWEAEYKVIVSQYPNQKLHSVCSLLGDYLECRGGAIVLADDAHVWVLGHTGLRSSVLHSDTFLSICHRAMKGRTSFSVSKRKRSVAGGAEQRDAFHFFAAAPILRHGPPPKAPVGCVVALDTRRRDDDAARKVQKTLENLAQLVMTLLVEEKTVLRIYASGDFRFFASNALDLAPASATPFERFGVAPSPKSATSAARTTRSRSLAPEDDAGFFFRYAESFGRPSDFSRTATPTATDTRSSNNNNNDTSNSNSRQHAVSNSEKQQALAGSQASPRFWKNESTLRAA
ncbi:hypothetical protein PybrP1_012011 [[Pythium] brassicae (nom. inval.)]|nr:hypothetical protein PybrP1_012011 [[Pythium] brassicae (nom. inval.)]